MRRATRALAFATAIAISTTALPAAADVVIVPAPIPPEIIALAATPEPPKEVPPPVVIPAKPITVDYAAVNRYIWKTIENYVRSLPAEQLIRLWWKDTPHVATMLRIAQRESHYNCAADNPTSSAAGLFQTIGEHRALAQSMGLSWADIEGPDCIADLKLAWQLYNGGRGLGHWALTR